MGDPINYISLARKAGLIETGEENSGIVIRSGKAKLLVLASDASDNAVRRAEGYIQNRSVPLVRPPFTKQELASAAGKSGCSMLVFTDLGLARGFVSALAEAYPERFTELSGEMDEKYNKAARRRGKTHGDTNKKMGKRRTNE